MTTIKDHLQDLRNTLPKSVELVAVSKFHPVSAIQEAYDAGQRLFGESRVQELTDKAPLLPKDIEWHMIGTLQRNKVKYIVPFIDTIHSVDSLRLLKEIEKQSNRLKREKPINVLLQVHLSDEETKHGFSDEDLFELMNNYKKEDYPHIQIAGLMGMAALTDDEALISRQFAHLHALFTRLKEQFFSSSSSFKHLSMGMSSDYHIAIKQGSTYVRIGTAIFGEREN